MSSLIVKNILSVQVPDVESVTVTVYDPGNKLLIVKVEVDIPAVVAVL